MIMCAADDSELQNIDWRVVIIDEAHRLKNRNCKLLEGLKRLGMEHRVLLTGTPLQNSVEELFSLLNFLEPHTFPSHVSFLQQFGDLKTEEQVEELKTVSIRRVYTYYTSLSLLLRERERESVGQGFV